MVIGAAMGGSVATSIGTVAAPFAFLSDAGEAALIAGTFALINTCINLFLVRRVQQTRHTAEEVKDVAEETKQIVDRRDRLVLPPPDGRYKRKDDPPIRGAGHSEFES